MVLMRIRMGKNSIEKQNYSTMLFDKSGDNRPLNINKGTKTNPLSSPYIPIVESCKKDATIVALPEIQNQTVVKAKEKLADNMLEKKKQWMKLQETEENKRIAQREIEQSTVRINGKIEDFEQGNTNDCWALTGIRALANTKKGAEIIKNSISQTKNGNVTVKLKGVNETYTFTPAQIKESEGRLSTGDDDVRVIEMAMEQHRLNIFKRGFYVGIGDINGERAGVQNPLESGCPSEAIFLLTGKDSEYYSSSGCFFADALISLSKIRKNPDKYAGTTSFKEEKDLVTNDHAYSIKSVDTESVTVVNPWDSSKGVKIYNNKFLENYYGVCIFDAEQK